MTDYHVSDIYQGGYSSLDSNKYGAAFTGYHLPVTESVQPSIEGYNTSQGSRLGVSTDPRNANILKEFSEKITPGERVIELSLIDIGEATASIPKQHFDEIRRLSKLTGVEVTVHGPITDASGVVEGRQFDENKRLQVERKLLQSIEKAHQINPDGNIPVTFHTSAGLPGPTWERDEKGKIQTVVMPVVNRETGQINQVKQSEHYSPSHLGGKEIWDVHKQLEIMNQNEWSDSIDQVKFNAQKAMEIMKDIHPIFVGKYLKVKTGELKLNDLLPEERQYAQQIDFAEAYLTEAQKKAGGLFDRASKISVAENDKIARGRLVETAESYSKTLGIKDGKAGIDAHNPFNQMQAIINLTNGLENLQPNLYVPTEDYALDKTAESYGNVAFEAFKKFGYKKEKDTTPLLLIENPPAGGGLSRAEDLKNLVKKSKENFIEKVSKSVEDGGLGISRNEAMKRAEELIGVTWDVGHINQLRKYGFTGKEIIKEAETIAPLVKHIHLSDNFGLDNVELPMGMGNVDFKEVMQKLGVNGEKARKIVEAAHWWQFQKSSPMGVSMEALGSPIYGMNMAPYWNQKDAFWQGYNGGFEGNWLPQTNYETFGGGFSNIPKELGGERGGAGRSRMGGTPME